MEVPYSEVLPSVNVRLMKMKKGGGCLWPKLGIFDMFLLSLEFIPCPYQLQGHKGLEVITFWNFLDRLDGLDGLDRLDRVLWWGGMWSFYRRPWTRTWPKAWQLFILDNADLAAMMILHSSYALLFISLDDEENILFTLCEVARGITYLDFNLSLFLQQSDRFLSVFLNIRYKEVRFSFLYLN